MDYDSHTLHNEITRDIKNHSRIQRYDFTNVGTLHNSML